MARVYELQRKAMWRLDYISSENSKGFHADQEAARILAESIDYSRRAEAMALRLRAGEAPSTEGLPDELVRGVTPTEEAPIDRTGRFSDGAGGVVRAGSRRGGAVATIAAPVRGSERLSPRRPDDPRSAPHADRQAHEHPLARG
jgi:hypothetical protein